MRAPRPGEKTDDTQLGGKSMKTLQLSTQQSAWTRQTFVNEILLGTEPGSVGPHSLVTFNCPTPPASTCGRVRGV